MIEFLKDLPEWAVTLFYILSIICSGGSVSVAFVGLFRAHAVEKALAKAKANESYIVCPHCGRKAAISDVAFYLKDGSLDNNLNGIADDKE